MKPVDVLLTPGAEVSRVSWDAGGLPCEGEYHDGTFWRTLFAPQDAAFYDWDTKHRKGNAKVRIRSISEYVTSDWVESDVETLTGKFSGNLWTAYLELGAALIWRGNVTGVLPQDTSGNARHATSSAVTAPNTGQAGIIFNRAAQVAIKHGPGSATPAVQRADVGAWVKTIKTILFWMKPTTYGTSDALALLLNRLNIQYNSGSGVLSSALPTGGIGSGVALAWPVRPSTGATHMIATVAGGGRHANYTDGAVVASRAIASPGAVGQDVYWMGAVGGAWNVLYQGFALFPDELDALQVAWLYQVGLNTPNEPPTTPGVFTVPAAADYDNSIAVAHGVSTDPEMDPIDYEYQRYNPETATWEPLALTVPLDTSAWLHRDGYKLRVRALDDPYEEFSAWRESATFDIVHARAVPATPAAPVWVWHSIRNLGFSSDAFSSPVPGATLRAVRWQFADNDDFTGPIEFTTERRFGFLPEHERELELDPDTEYWARYAFEDEIGRVGAWSPAVRGRTSNEHGGVRYIVARDESGHARHATYGLIAGSDGSSFLNHGAGSPSLRFPSHLLDDSLPSTSRGFYTGAHDHKADWRDTDNPIVIDGEWSIMLRFIPMALSAAGLLGLGRYDDAAPMTSGNTGWRIDATHVFIHVHLQTGNGAENLLRVNLKAIGELGELHTVIVRGDGATDEGEPGGLNTPASIIYADDEVVFDLDAINAGIGDPDDRWVVVDGGGHFLTSWLTVGHYGAAPNVGGLQIFRGIPVELAAWSSDFLDGKTDAELTRAAIAATIGDGLELWHRYNDPDAPTTPELAGAMGEE